MITFEKTYVPPAPASHSRDSIKYPRITGAVEVAQMLEVDSETPQWRIAAED
jgi:hypothetical protein